MEYLGCLRLHLQIYSNIPEGEKKHCLYHHILNCLGMICAILRARSLASHCESSKVDFENCRGIGGKGELLKEGCLDEHIGLQAFRLLHGDLQPSTTDETSCHLCRKCVRKFSKITLLVGFFTSLKFTVLRTDERVLALSILASRTWLLSSSWLLPDTLLCGVAIYFFRREDPVPTY